MKFGGAAHINNLLHVRNQFQVKSNGEPEFKNHGSKIPKNSIFPISSSEMESDVDQVFTSDKITFLTFRGNPFFNISLQTLRMFLFVIHLIALWASIRAFMVWEEVQPFMPRNDHGIRVGESHWLNKQVGTIRSCEILYFDVLIASYAFYMLIYYVFVGIGITVQFGSSVKNIYFLLLLSPVILLLIIFECSIILFIIDNRHFIRVSLEYEVMFKNTLDERLYCLMVYLHHYINQDALKTMLTYSTCASIQFFTILLPFFVRNLPFQKKKIWSTKMDVHMMEINKIFTRSNFDENQTPKENYENGNSDLEYRSAGYVALFNYN